MKMEWMALLVASLAVGIAFAIKSLGQLLLVAPRCAAGDSLGSTGTKVKLLRALNQLYTALLAVGAFAIALSILIRLLG